MSTCTIISRTGRILGGVEKWIEATMYDQSIGYAEASDVVMAKILAKTVETKRQNLRFVDGKFEVTTVYVKDEQTASAIVGQPHVEVLEGGIKLGCITITDDAI